MTSTLLISDPVADDDAGGLRTVLDISVLRSTFIRLTKIFIEA